MCLSQLSEQHEHTFFNGNMQDINHSNMLQNYTFQIIMISPGGQWVNSIIHQDDKAIPDDG